MNLVQYQPICDAVVIVRMSFFTARGESPHVIVLNPNPLNPAPATVPTTAQNTPLSFP